ncbi:hypothetical protein Tco_0335426 [Tanacetum coccineum]
MGDENHICTLGDYSKPSHEGYRNTTELPEGNNVVPLRFDTIRRTIDQSASGKLRDLNAEEFWALLEDLALYDTKVVPTTLSIAWKISNKTLLNTRPSVPMKREVSGIPSSPSKTILVTPTIHPGKVTPTLEGLVSEFMASQDAKLFKFEANFKQQQSEMTNKINTMLKAITDRIAGTLPSDTVMNPKLGTHPVLSARSYLTNDPQCSTHIHSSINAVTIHPKQPEESQDNEPDVGQEEKGNLGNINSNPHRQPDPLASIATKHVRKLNSLLESLGLVPQSSNTKFVCNKEEDGEVMFIEIIRDNEPQNESPNEGEGTTTEGLSVEYFNTFPTSDELTYHKYHMCTPIPSIFLRNPIITEGCSSNLKIPCNIGHVHVEKAYIDLNSPLNIMTPMMYNWIMRRKPNPMENANG